MRTLARLLAALTALGGCGPFDAEADPDSSARRQAISGGQLDPADPDVYMLEWTVFGLPNMCSATLISPRTLLTAAHCLDTRLYPGGAQLRFRATHLANARSAGPADWVAVTETRIHPQYGNGVSAFDLALALLEQPSTVAPRAWNQTALGAVVGQPARVVGYGVVTEDDYSSWGKRRQVSLPIRAVDASYLTVGDQNGKGFCSGDSGGPTLLTLPDGIERVVGVHSHGPTCDDGKDVRVDVHRAFIQAWLDEKEPADAGVGARDGGGPVDAGSASDAAIRDAGHDAGVTEQLPAPSPGPEPEPEPEPQVAPPPLVETTKLRPRGCGAAQTGLAPGAVVLLLAITRRRVSKGR